MHHCSQVSFSILSKHHESTWQGALGSLSQSYLCYFSTEYISEWGLYAAHSGESPYGSGHQLSSPFQRTEKGHGPSKSSKDSVTSNGMEWEMLGLPCTQLSQPMWMVLLWKGSESMIPRSWFDSWLFHGPGHGTCLSESSIFICTMTEYVWGLFWFQDSSYVHFWQNERRKRKRNNI